MGRGGVRRCQSMILSTSASITSRWMPQMPRRSQCRQFFWGHGRGHPSLWGLFESQKLAKYAPNHGRRRTHHGVVSGRRSVSHALAKPQKFRCESVARCLTSCPPYVPPIGDIVPLTDTPRRKAQGAEKDYALADPAGLSLSGASTRQMPDTRTGTATQIKMKTNRLRRAPRCSASWESAWRAGGGLMPPDGCGACGRSRSSH